MPAPIPADPIALWLGTWSRPTDPPAQVALALACLLLVTSLVPKGPLLLASAVGLSVSGEGGRDRTRRFLALAGLAAAFLSIGYVEVYLHGGPRALDAPVYWLQGRGLSHGMLSWTVPSPTASYRARGFLAASPFSDRVSGIFPLGYPLLLAAGFLVGAPMLVGPLLAGGLVLATWQLAREVATRPGERTSALAEQAGTLAAALSIVCAALRQQTADTLPHGAVALAMTVALASALRFWRTREPRALAITGLALAWLASALWPPFGHLAAESLGVQAAPDLKTGTALATALGNLRHHMMDVANFEPLAFALPLAFSRGRRTRAASCTALVIACHLLVHARSLGHAGPPWGDLSEVLPLEHAIIGYGLACAFGRSFERVTLVTLGLALAGFALHAAPVHRNLGESDLGRPHFEPDALHQANVTSGLLLFDDDQGFALAAAPGVDASRGIQAVRLKGDDHDRLAYDVAGHPPAHRYVALGVRASVPVWSPPGFAADYWRFEAESDWPLSALGGTARRLEVPESCASGASVLALSPAGTEASAVLEVPVPVQTTGTPRVLWTVTPRIYEMGATAEATLDLVESSGGPPLAHWSWRDEAKGHSCRDLSPTAIVLGGPRPRVWLILKARGGPVALDRTLLR